jgi:16S rRNA (cytidine1402-2'-O)-methyltransferase
LTKSLSSSQPVRSILFIVATPIGNLEDVTLRAIRVLKEVDLIACEDTRRTIKLLNHYGIQKRLVSYHEHNESTRAAEIVEMIESGANVAVVSDAGTPLISDPGRKLTALCVERGIRVVPIPGPSSVLAALTASGLPNESFVFAGFLPPKQGDRRRALTALADEGRAMIFFEAPHRIAKTLADMSAILGARQAVLARELTKLHEEFLRGTLPELALKVSEAPPKGEITLIIGPCDSGMVAARPVQQSVGLAIRVNEIMREQGLDKKSALKQAAKEFGITRREAYKRLLQE